MCGIAGVVSLTGETLGPDANVFLKAMGRAIGYRGPDDEQIHRDGPLGFVFRRLSIVDLEGGRQPLSNEDGSLLLMVNGEIYNHIELRHQLKEEHSFATRSDSEIVLHLYEEHGLDFVHHLNGMYAIALWDKRRRRLILARDRLGIKPLFYAVSKHRVLFGSEIKALLQHPDCPRAFDWEAALADPDLMRPAIDGSPKSYFKGIEQLAPASFVVVDLHSGALTKNSYWSLPNPTEAELRADRRTEGEIVEQYSELVEDSVKKCLMADVEYGVFLSGGIDSVAISAVASEAASFHTFSVLNQTSFSTGDARAAHIACKRFGLINHQVLFDWHRLPLAPDDWKQLVWLCEMPLCHWEQLAKFHLHRFAKMSRPGLKVILLGQGSDEFNGGYSAWYTEHLPEEKRNWAGYIDSVHSLGRALALEEKSPRYRRWNEIFGRRILADSFINAAGMEQPTNLWHMHGSHAQYRLAMYNLWHEDRTASGNNIESRVPFLDHRIVEFTARIPPQFHESLFWDKRILRRAMHKRLGSELAERPKIGFLASGEDARYSRRMLFEVVLGHDGQLIDEAFPSGSDARQVIDPASVRDVVEAIKRDPNHSRAEQIVSLINMGLLDQMAKNSDMGLKEKRGECFPEIEVRDWNQQESEIALRLGIRRSQINIDNPIAFAPTVVLVRPDNAKAAVGEWWLVVDDHVTFVLSKAEVGAWIEVLRRIDGERSLASILSELNVNAAEIRKHLEEAIDYNILEFPDAERVFEPDSTLNPPGPARISRA